MRINIDSSNSENSPNVPKNSKGKLNGREISESTNFTKLKESIEKIDISYGVVFKKDFLVSENPEPESEKLNKTKEAEAIKAQKKDVLEDDDFDFQESDSELDESASEREQAVDELNIGSNEMKTGSVQVNKGIEERIVSFVKTKDIFKVLIEEKEISDVAKEVSDVAKEVSVNATEETSNATAGQSAFIQQLEDLLARHGDLYIKDKNTSLRSELDNLKSLQQQMKNFPSSKSIKEEFESSLKELQNALKNEQLFVKDPKTGALIPLSSEKVKLIRQEIDLIFSNYYHSQSPATIETKTSDEKEKKEHSTLKFTLESANKTTRYDSITFEAKVLSKNDPSSAKLFLLLKIFEAQIALIELQRDKAKERKLREQIKFVQWLILKDIESFELKQQFKKDDQNKSAILTSTINKIALEHLNIRHKLVSGVH